eukprot:4399272-Amphidinium_carterae.1
MWDEWSAKERATLKPVEGMLCMRSWKQGSLIRSIGCAMITLARAYTHCVIDNQQHCCCKSCALQCLGCTLSEWILPVMYGEFLPPTLHLEKMRGLRSPMDVPKVDHKMLAAISYLGYQYGPSIPKATLQASVSQAEAQSNHGRDMKLKQDFVKSQKPLRFARTIPHGDQDNMPGCEICDLHNHESFEHFLHPMDFASDVWRSGGPKKAVHSHRSEIRTQ